MIGGPPGMLGIEATGFDDFMSSSQVRQRYVLACWLVGCGHPSGLR